MELWDSDLGGLINYLLATTYTDDDGYYQFPPINNDDGFLEDGLDVFVKEYSDNSIVKVTDDSGNLYWGQTGVDSNVPDGWHNMGSWAVTGDNRGNKAILDTIEIGHEYASSLGYNHVKVEARWPSDGTYVPLDDPLTIHLLSGDEWDEDVILHEYSHTIQHSIYGEWIPNAGGPHTWNQHTNPNFAFSEGWPTFFAVTANFEMGYGDSLYPQDSWYRDHVDIIINHELETDNHASGVDVESAVVCLLWDIYDSWEDVLVHGTDSLSAGMSPIWDVFANYLTGGHHVYNIHPEFWGGWFDRGHNHYQVMRDIYYHHCLLNNPPNTPSTPSGPTSGYRNVWYTYSATATDPDGDNIRYEFEFSGPIPTVSFTTGWYASGQTGSLTVMWETTDPLGTYQIRVRAQDVYGEWSNWSPYLTVK